MEESKDRMAYPRRAWRPAGRALKWDSYKADLLREKDNTCNPSTEVGHREVARITSRDMCRTGQRRMGKEAWGAIHATRVLELLADNRYWCGNRGLLALEV